MAKNRFREGCLTLFQSTAGDDREPDNATQTRTDKRSSVTQAAHGLVEQLLTHRTVRRRRKITLHSTRIAYCTQRVAIYGLSLNSHRTCHACQQDMKRVSLLPRSPRTAPHPLYPLPTSRPPLFTLPSRTEAIKMGAGGRSIESSAA